MSRVRELTFNVDTLSDVDLSGVNTTLRHLSTKKRPVEPRHIVDFSAISRPDDRTVILRVTLDEGIFVADTTSPRNGKNFITGHAPEVATVVMSNALDPNLNGTVKFDGSTVPSAQVTLDGQHVLKIDLATAFPSTYNAVGGHTIEVSGFADIEGNPQTQDEMIGYAVDPLASSIDTGEVMPYTANLKTGILRCSRLVMERGANIEEQLTRYLRQRGMDREHILHQSLVTTNQATLELYVLYLESVNPRLLKSFPNQGSTLSLSNPPTTYFFTFSAPLSLQCIQNNQAVLYDGTYVGDANVSLTPDEQTLVVDISGLAGANTAGLHSFELTDLCGVDGVNFTSVPTYIDVTVAEVPDADATAGGGGGGNADSFGAIDADGTTVNATGDDTLVLDPGNAITITGDDPNTSVTVAVDETQISHTNIADIGSLTHPQIDTQIGQLQTDVGTNTTDIGTNTTNIGNNATAITNLDNDLTAHTGASNPHGTTIVDLADTPAVAANTDEILRWNGTAWVFVADLTNLETDVTNNTTAINNHITTTTGNPHQVTLEEARTQGDTFSGPVNLPAADPTLSTHAAHKGYVDSEISALPAPPTADSDLTNDQYVTGVNGVNGPGPVTIDPDDLSDASTTNKFVTAAEKAAISTAVQSVNGVSGTTPVIDPDDLDDASTAHKFVSQAEKDDIATAVQPGDSVDFTSVTQGGTAVILEGDSRLTDARTPLAHTHPISDIPSIDQDDMASDSDQHVPTQQSVKAYVDNEIAALPSAPVADVNGQTGNVLIGIQELDETFLPVANNTNTGKVLEWDGTAWVLGAEKLTPTGDGSGLTNITPGQVGADPAGTDNSTDVTLAGTPNYITISATGQIITRHQIDLANDVTGQLPQTGVNGLPADIAEKDDLITLSGVNATDTDLGTFTGATILDNRNVKQALQDLETETEQKIEFTDLSAGGDLSYDGSGGFSFTERTDPEVNSLADARIAAAAGVSIPNLSGGKIPSSQLPAIAISEYLGAVGSQAALTALSGQEGDWAIRTDENKTYIITTGTGSNFSDWVAVATPSAPATNLGNNPGTNTVEITSSTGANTTIPAATTGLAGVMTDSDKSKLDGIDAGAQVNVNTNLGLSKTATQNFVTSSTGTNITLVGAEPTTGTNVAGLMTAQDKSDLDGLVANAPYITAETSLTTTGTGSYITPGGTNGHQLTVDPIDLASTDVTGVLPAGNVSLDIDNLNDVTITGTPTAAQVIKWDGTSAFINAQLAYSDITGTPSLATVATSGAYSDLSGTPTLATVATSGAYSDLTGTPSLAAVATSGAYADLTGTPSLATVATSGAYSDLSGLPSLATVATSGAYSDLTGTPSIPVSIDDLNDATISGTPTAVQVLKWDGTSAFINAQLAYSDISGTPSLATVATSGAYSDLSGTPTLATVATSGAYSDLTGTPSLAAVATSGAYGDLSGTPTLATVATSGSYNDLSNKPTIPADLDDLGDVTITTGTLSAVQVLKYDGSSAFVNDQLTYSDIANTPSLAAVATSGNYSDLSGTPSLAAVATSGAYADLSGTPTLATVATSGSYNDLSNKPTIPADLDDLSDVTITTGTLSSVQVLKWDGASAFVNTQLAYSDIANTPSLAAVATSGAYGDLSGTPSLAAVATSGAYGDLSGTPSLAAVATSGAYGDLSGTPTIPTKATLDVDDLEALVGAGSGATNLGTFGGAGTILTDGISVKEALEELEAETEQKIDTNANLTGINQGLATTDSVSFTGLTVDSGNASPPTVTVKSSVSGTTAAPEIDLVKDATAAANQYLGQIRFKGENSAGAEHLYAKITGKINSPTATSEEGIMEFEVDDAGTNKIVMRLRSDKVVINNDGGSNPTNLDVSGNLDVTGNIATDGTITSGGTAVVLNDDARLDAATTSQDGLLSTTDKTRLDNLHNNTANYITSGGAPVQSVNSLVGAVSLNADNIPEAATTPTNLYFTDARADDRIAAADIGDLNDVTIGTKAEGEVLRVNSSGVFINTDLVAADISNSTTVGRALITATDEQAGRNALSLGSAATLNVPVSGDAAAGEVVKGNDARLATNLTYDATNRIVESSTGTDATLPLATTSDAGLMSAQDKTDLGNALVNGAQVNLGTGSTLNSVLLVDENHTHTATDITDSTTVGRNVLTASSKGAARFDIGIGTGSESTLDDGKYLKWNRTAGQYDLGVMPDAETWSDLTGGGTLTLNGSGDNNKLDIDISGTLSNGEVLKWDSGNGKFVVGPSEGGNTDAVEAQGFFFG